MLQTTLTRLSIIVKRLYIHIIYLLRGLAVVPARRPRAGYRNLLIFRAKIEIFLGLGQSGERNKWLFTGPPAYGVEIGTYTGRGQKSILLWLVQDIYKKSIGSEFSQMSRQFCVLSREEIKTKLHPPDGLWISSL